MSDDVAPPPPTGPNLSAPGGWRRLAAYVGRNLAAGTTRLRAMPVTLAAICGLAAWVLLFTDFTASVESRLRDMPFFFDAAEEGLIIVDAPQLFTRERLVNERLRESEWIDSQIASVNDKLAKGEFARVDGMTLTERLLSLRGGDAGGNGNSDSNNGSGVVGVPGSNSETETGTGSLSALRLLSELSALRPSPLVAFEAASDYRERLALQRYATILDDAHDIGENTLHRLNFRLTLAPARSRTDSLVGVSLRMRQAFDQGNMLQHYAKLTVDLRKQLEVLIDKLVIDRSLLFDVHATYRIDPQEEAAIDQLLTQRLDELGQLAVTLRAAKEPLVAAALDLFWEDRRDDIEWQVTTALAQKQPGGFWSKVVRALDRQQAGSFVESAAATIAADCRRPYWLLDLVQDRATAERIIEELAVSQLDPQGPPVAVLLQEPVSVRCWETINAVTIAKLRVIGFLHHLAGFATQNPFRCDDADLVKDALRVTFGAAAPGITKPEECRVLLSAAERLHERLRQSGVELGQTGLTMLIRYQLAEKRMETTRRARTLGGFFTFDTAGCTVERCEVRVYTKGEYLKRFGKKQDDALIAAAWKKPGWPEEPTLIVTNEKADQQDVTPEVALEGRARDAGSKSTDKISLEGRVLHIGRQEALRLFLELACFSEARSYTVWPRAGARDSVLSSQVEQAAVDVGAGKAAFGATARGSANSARRRDIDHVFGIGDWGEPVAAGQAGAEQGGSGRLPRPQCSEPLSWVLENYDVDDDKMFPNWMDAGEHKPDMEQWWQGVKQEICSAGEDDCKVDLQALVERAVGQHDIATHAAWIVVPRNDDPGGPTRHIPMSLPLSAIVSLPSWWGGLEIEVLTCWIRPRKLQGQLQAGSLCELSEETPPHVIHLPLPGRSQDVLQKLGFFILRTPYLDVADHLQETQAVEAGRPASIRLTGGRLWKNPRVRLGAQWHDSIEVLPNMQGLIARFDCVEPSSNGDKQVVRSSVVRALHFNISEAERRRVGVAGQAPSVYQEPPNAYSEDRPVQVWTSEGVTTPHAVEVRAFRPRHFLAGEPEKPCWVEPNGAGPTSASDSENSIAE